MKAEKKKKPRAAFGRLIEAAPGRWRVLIPTGEKSPTGRTRYKTFTFETKKAAEKFRKDAHLAKMTGTLVLEKPEEDQGDLTLAQAIEDYIADQKRKGTRKGYRSLATAVQHASSPLAGMLAENVTPDAVRGFLEWKRTHVFHAHRPQGWKKGDPLAVKQRQGAETSGATLNRYRTLLEGTFSRLMERDEVAANPVKRVKKYPEPKKPRVVLSKSEAGRLIAGCEPHFRPFILTLLYTGARLGEVLRLKWQDVRLEDKRILITRTKTGNTSAIPMNPVLEEELKALRASRPRIPRDTDCVFLNTLGKPLTDVVIPWRKAIKAAGLEDRERLDRHALRHTFATHFLERGAAITDLQAILGHASPVTTAIYARAIDARTAASIGAMDFGIKPEKAAIKAG